MKMKTEGLVIVVLAAVLLASTLRISATTSTAEYNPWYDLDGDGKITIYDVVKVTGIYGSSGDPFAALAALEYDSGWIDITDKAGQYFNVTHNLNSTDIIVDITGKTTLDGGVHQIHLGGTGYTQGWTRTYGGTDYDSAGSVVHTSDGGYAIAGGTQSFGAGNTDFWLIKTDVSGNQEWNRTYGGASSEGFRSFVQTVDGGYAIAGITYGTYGSWDFWLVKTDTLGNMQWNQTYGGTGNDRARFVQQTDDGGYIVGGITTSFGAGNTDFWLIKTNSTGHVEWDRTYGGAGAEEAYSGQQTSGGGYILAGNGYGGFWLVKTDTLGNMQWNQTYGGPYGETPLSVQQTSDGGYIVAGLTNSHSAGLEEDFWLVKTNADGNMLWNKTYGGPDYEQARSVVQTCDSGYIVVGTHYTGELPGIGGDIWLVKTDVDGNMLWNKTYGGEDEDEAFSVVETSDGGYAIAGGTQSFGAGNWDFWLVRTDSTGNVHACFKYGLAWTDSTVDTITLYRGATDPYWNYFRVRIWKIKETP